MKRALVALSLLIFGLLIAYFRLSQPRVDLVSADADSKVLPESSVLPLQEVEKELPLAEAEPPVTDTSAELHAYFRSLPYLANNFSVPYIHCLETMCGIPVIGYGQDAGKHWVRAISDMESRSCERAEKLDTRVSVEPIRSDAIGFVVYTMNITEEEAP